MSPSRWTHSAIDTGASLCRLSRLSSWRFPQTSGWVFDARPLWGKVRYPTRDRVDALQPKRGFPRRIRRESELFFMLQLDIYSVVEAVT